MSTDVLLPLKPFWQHSDLGDLRQLILMNTGKGGRGRGGRQHRNVYESTAPEKIVLLTALIQVWLHHENKHLHHLKYSNCQHRGPRRTGLPYL